PHHLLTEEQLKTIYNSYPAKHLRNKVVLGLLVFQALRRKEIHQLKVEPINLETGQVHIKSSRKANGRILSLAAVQLLPLQSYLANYKTAELFPSAHLHYAQYYLIKQLKPHYPKLLSCRQLRASVISNWLRHHNLRQVQYMAGHRYVSSTERYNRSHLEDLQRDLDEYHPSND
ncbi:MAG: site-specific integrase, partial [Bacteroidota bacterium]